MPRDEYEIRRLLEDGISVEVSAQDFDEFELGRMLESAVEGNATLFVNDSDEFDEYEIRRIAEHGKHNVVFRYSVDDEEDEEDEDNENGNESSGLPSLPKFPAADDDEEDDKDEDEECECDEFEIEPIAENGKRSVVFRQSELR
jgi:hypothetical protein